MKRRRCTARVEHGRTKTKACGVTGDCTRVRIYNEAGDLLTTRWVCFTCRQRMRLPEYDVDFRPGDTEVGDEIVDDDLAGDSGEDETQEFRLP